MLRHLMTHWREARGTDLKRQFENAFLYPRDLGDEQAERFGRGLNHLFDTWVKRCGPVKDCEIRIRKQTVKEPRADARRRYEHDWRRLRDRRHATFVYDLTSYYISQNGDAARGTTVEPGRDARLERFLISPPSAALRGAIKAERVGCGW
jgi:hypothetical protein